MQAGDWSATSVFLLKTSGIFAIYLQLRSLIRELNFFPGKTDLFLGELVLVPQYLWAARPCFTIMGQQSESPKTRHSLAFRVESVTQRSSAQSLLPARTSIPQLSLGSPPFHSHWKEEAGSRKPVASHGGRVKKKNMIIHVYPHMHPGRLPSSLTCHQMLVGWVPSLLITVPQRTNFTWLGQKVLF